MDEKHRNYLLDLGYLLHERAVEARQRREAAKGSAGEAFETGRAFAYYEVISLMLSQAETFELPVEDLHLEGVDLDRDLL